MILQWYAISVAFSKGTQTAKDMKDVVRNSKSGIQTMFSNLAMQCQVPVPFIQNANNEFCVTVKAMALSSARGATIW